MPVNTIVTADFNLFIDTQIKTVFNYIKKYRLGYLCSTVNLKGKKKKVPQEVILFDKTISELLLLDANPLVKTSCLIMLKLHILI